MSTVERLLAAHQLRRPLSMRRQDSDMIFHVGMDQVRCPEELTLILDTGTATPVENQLQDSLDRAPHGDPVGSAAIDQAPAERRGVDVDAADAVAADQSPVEQAVAGAIPGHGKRSRTDSEDGAIDLAFTNPTELPGR